jgi:Mrp family chromosome partitioning ATPase/uncharacterized protein involved in exopolysaccharide biosynthesis
MNSRSAATEEESEPKRRSIDPLASLRAHTKLVKAVLLATIIAAPLGAWLKGRPYYAAEGLLYVSPRYATMLQENKELELQSNSQYRQFVQQQVRAITRYEVLDRALDALGPKSALWLGEDETRQSGIERLMKKLEARPLPDTHFVRVRLVGGGREGLAEIVNAVLDTYVEVQKNEHLYGRPGRLRNLKRHREELQIQRDSLVAELQSMSTALGAMRFDEMFASENGRPLTDIKALLKERRVRLMQLKSQYAEGHPSYRSAKRELALLDKEMSRFSASPEAATRVDSMRGEITRLEDRIRLIDDRVDFFTLEAKSPGMVWVGSRARTPDKPEKDRRKKFLILLLGAGIAFSLMLPIAVDQIDPRVHDVEDAERLFGFRPMGWLPDGDSQWPEHARRDALRDLAVSFIRQHRTAGLRVFGVSSVQAGGGTTTVAITAADELARLGYKAIVIEANPFNPDIRFSQEGGSEVPGFSDIASGNAAGGSIEAGDGALRLPYSSGIGERVAPVQGLEKTLAGLRERFDFVILDVPPLLGSPDAGLYLGLVDAAVVVVESGAIDSFRIRRSLVELKRIDPAALGVVVNAVPPERGRAAVSDPFDIPVNLKRDRFSRLLSDWVLR